MNWVIACGVFFLCGGALFGAAAFSLCRGRGVVPVEAVVIAVREEQDGVPGETEYEYADGETKVRVCCPFGTDVPTGGTERMYRDCRRDVLIHPRLPRALFGAAACFAAAGALALVLGCTVFG